MSKGRLLTSYYRPSTFFYDETRNTLPNFDPGVPFLEPHQKSEGFHFKAMKPPDIDPACQNVLYSLIHKQFADAFTKSKVEGRYIPIPIDVAARHMMYFDQFEEVRLQH